MARLVVSPRIGRCSDLGSGPIEIFPYDPSWPAHFDQWRRRIQSALGARAIRIEHVGSTSIPGLDAKPIVDIQVSVGSFEPFEEIRGPLESVGFTYRVTDWPEHRYFFIDDVHVHVCEKGSDWERAHILFRDFLRSHPDRSVQYLQVKRQLAVQFRNDRMGYTDGKDEVVAEILEAAEGWARRTGWRF